MEFMNKLGQQLKEQITQEIEIKRLLDEAAFTERFLTKPKPPAAPKMWDLLMTSYDKEDAGYWNTTFKLRATPKQITRWEFAIDILLMIKSDISKDPMFDRKLVWLKANRFKWTQLQRMLGVNRTTLKKRYEKLLDVLSRKVNKQIKFDTLNRILYLI